MYDNGFLYQGMFENDEMSGVGLSIDPQLNKYMGQHDRGMRQGFGIYEARQGQGNKYEGTWRENRLHGKVKEYLETGQNYLVFFNNGKRVDLISLEKKGGGKGKQVTRSMAVDSNSNVMTQKNLRNSEFEGMHSAKQRSAPNGHESFSDHRLARESIVERQMRQMHQEMNAGNGKKRDKCVIF